MIAHQRAHIGADRLVPPGDGDVEGVVADRLLRPFPPLPVGVQNVLLRIGDHEIDDRRGAADAARGRPGLEILGRHGAHEGQLHVGVRIDAARHHITAARIDGLGARRRFQILADGGDPVAVQKHVGAEAAVRIHDGSAPDQSGHLGFSQRYRRRGRKRRRRPEPNADITANRTPAPVGVRQSGRPARNIGAAANLLRKSYDRWLWEEVILSV